MMIHRWWYHDDVDNDDNYDDQKVHNDDYHNNYPLYKKYHRSYYIIITLLLIPATKYLFIVANVNTAPLVSLSAMRSTLLLLLSTWNISNRPNEGSNSPAISWAVPTTIYYR